MYLATDGSTVQLTLDQDLQFVGNRLSAQPQPGHDLQQPVAEVGILSVEANSVLVQDAANPAIGIPVLALGVVSHSADVGVGQKQAEETLLGTAREIQRNDTAKTVRQEVCPLDTQMIEQSFEVAREVLGCVTGRSTLGAPVSAQIIERDPIVAVQLGSDL